MQSRQAIRRAIRSNPNARVIVTGCYAQIEPEEIKKISGVSRIIGNRDKESIPEIISSENVGNHRETARMKNKPNQHSDGRTRPFIKIQDGCNTFCTYCIVPYARGRSRSVEPELVHDTIQGYTNSGYKEVVLTGVHLGEYGLDLSPSCSLKDLLSSIEGSARIERVRLSSIEPHELTVDIIKLIAESNIFCNHFHIPIQSGSDRILKMMKRPYTASHLETLVNKIHTSIPDAAIGADIMVGFPGETDDDFKETNDLIKNLPFSYLHVFPFSPRKGTPAFKYPGRVPQDCIKIRSKNIRALGFIKKKYFYDKFVKKKVDALIETRRDKKTGLLKGMASNYIPVFLQGEDMYKNKIIPVTIDRVSETGSVFGRI